MSNKRGFLGLPEGIARDPEFQSSLVRLAVWTFGTVYISLAALTGYHKVDVPYFLTLFSFFTLVYLGLFVSILVHPGWLPRRYLALSLDIIAISLAIFITREAISPFYLLYIWIFISAGTRYGTRHLVLASVEAVIAYALVLSALDQWSRHPFEAIFFLLLLVILPLYQYSLLRRVQLAKEEAERASKAKGDFLAFMTHELRTPLTGVIGMTELLKGTRLDADQRDYVLAISNSANVLNALIGDILDFSKIDAQRLKLERVPFDLRALVREVCGVLESQALAEGVEMICEVTPEVPDAVVGDQLRVRQILFNLLGNAVKFTEEGEVMVRVSARPAGEGLARPHLLLEVIDTGIGIPADKLALIFESFSQADDSTTRRFGGSGLGTTIALELATLMGGTIGVDSEEGRGSRFWVRLPLLGETLPRAPEPERRLQGRNALIIEPNATQRQLARAALEREGVRCIAVADLESGVAAIPQPASLDFWVIADSPQGRDLEAEHRALGAASAGQARPCLFLTYAARRPAGRRDGAGCLPKPFVDRQLVRAAEVLLGLVEPSEETGDGAPERGEDGIAGGSAGLVRVLVAEDNVIAARVITTFLSKMGFEHALVGDGEQALEAALTGTYGIAIVDLRMPKLDGIAFARRFRAQSPHHPMPIVALTANASEDVKQTCLDAGMDDFLAKPVSPELLRATVERLALPA